jgi:hypothetical protein
VEELVMSQVSVGSVSAVSARGSAVVAAENSAGKTYSVLLLPRYEIVARGMSYRDANAWVQTYNDALQGEPTRAVMAEEVSQHGSAAA